MKINNISYQSTITTSSTRSRLKKFLPNTTKIKQKIELDKTAFKPENAYKLPLKMYLIGLMIPLPFMSTAGFLFGSILAIGIKLNNFIKNKKLHYKERNI